MMKFKSVVSSSILCDSYIQSIIATLWQPIGLMLVPPKTSSWIPRVYFQSNTVWSQGTLSWSHQPTPWLLFPACDSLPSRACMQGRSKQSTTCQWSNPIIADLVESKIQRSQSAVCWNPDSQRIKTYRRCPSCCSLVWEWKDLNSAAGPLWLSVRPMTAILTVIN